jgi:endonuclease III
VCAAPGRVVAGAEVIAMTRDDTVRTLLEKYGHSFADQAGIRLADTPSPLYRLLVLAHLLSARISADVAVAAARELSAAGYRTPRRMLDATWQQRVDALGRGHYRRYDERTATQLGDGAQLLLERWHGDLRRLRDEADGTAAGISRLLTEFPGIGPTGADIFLREVQSTWPSVAPYADERVRSTARTLRLPHSAAGLAKLVPAAELPRLAAALIRAHGHEQELRAA